MLNLYSLSNEMQEILDLGYDEETTKELLGGYIVAGIDQVDDIIAGIRTLQAELISYDYEIQRLSQIKARKEKSIDSLKLLIDVFMQSSKQTKLETKLAKISYLPSEVVVISDESLIDLEYIKTKTSTAIDKAQIKKDIKNGIIVEGAFIEKKQNLQIK